MVQLATSTCVFLLVCFPFLTSAIFKTSHGSHVSKRFLHAEREGVRPSEANRKLFFKNQTFRTVTVAARHDSIVLDCEAAGSPTPTIHWLKDGTRIVQGNFESLDDDVPSLEDMETDSEQPVEKLRLSSTKSRLYLDCLNSASEGEYTCVAETPYMRKYQSTIVKVTGHRASHIDSCVVKRSVRGEPARIYMWTVSRLEYESTTVQLFCRASGSPAPAITWYDQLNNTLDDSEQYSNAVNGDLLIRDISWPNNMGVYRCSAENEYGAQSVETFLYPTPREDRFGTPE